MTILRHSLEIGCEPKKAFDLALDVENWPTYFSPCQAVEILEENDHFMRFHITALANGQVMSWESSRKIDRASLTILFEQAKPSPLLQFMKGAWRYYQTDKGTMVSLEHEYEVKKEVKGLVPGVTTQEEAQQFMEKCIHENTVRELTEIKAILETKSTNTGLTSRHFTEQMLIQKPIEELYQALANAKAWPTLLPHCSAMLVNYDDGIYQEMQMTVKTNAGDETIRTIRHLYPNRAIHYFQVEPPKVLKTHHGSWTFLQTSDGVLVSSHHEIVLNSEVAALRWPEKTKEQQLAYIEKAISDNSHKTLVAIRDQNLIRGV